VSFLTTIAVWVRARIAHLAGVEQFVLCLVTLASALVIVNVVIPYIAKLRNTKLAALRFGEWHGGTARNFPSIALGYPGWVSVLNPLTHTAMNVAARIDFVNEPRTASHPVPEAQWYYKTVKNGANIEGWQASVDIEPGEDQSFIFYFAEKGNNATWACKSGIIPVAQLASNHWIAHVHVQSDNVRGFEGDIGFTVSQNGVTRDIPAFTRQRFVPPRMKP
jgi:hypothetical protein